MDRFVLPDAPATLKGAVKAWSQPVTIPTYSPMPADKNPMFLEKRVYQGSSGRVYPLPFIDRISDTKAPRAWQAIHIENEFVRLMILPELGGRIHVGLDKTNGYDFFYRQNVIKPALVGLAGPWISGGVEFNWPQHHRPSTFMPTDVEIENHDDGSVTVWCSETEPMNRMKGMHGVCLHPGKSIIELKVRLYNRTELPQTFLWWANVAARVHERYQSFFPPDVRYVADHAKRAMSRFPLSDGRYYGVDYGARASRRGQSTSTDCQFVPPNDLYAPNDLSWYANIPVPTSYMAMGSREDFFGGYDHAKEAGFVHFADHRIAPGKKQWTWGNHAFGYAWDRNLTEEDGPYIELMAGVFTDNQPDFSFLQPGETRQWSQFWYPIQKIGPPQQANLEAAVSLTWVAGRGTLRLGVTATRRMSHAHVRLLRQNAVVADFPVTLDPATTFVHERPIANSESFHDYAVTVTDEAGSEVITYRPEKFETSTVPAAAAEPPLPERVGNIEELYLIGVHLEQYRHATRLPETYWQEALKRDPADSRCNNALGRWHLRRGEFDAAAAHFRAAIATLTKFNPNPPDGEAFYNLGVVLRHLDHLDDARDALSKATWNGAWQAPAHFILALIDCRQRRWTDAIQHLDATLHTNPDHSDARLILSLAQRRCAYQQTDSKIRAAMFAAADYALTSISTQGDRLHSGEKFLMGQTIATSQSALDLAILFGSAGFYDETLSVLRATATVEDGTAPLVHYYRAFFLDRSNQPDAAAVERAAAVRAAPDYCFPSRLEEIAILREAIQHNPHDARAPYYLANLYYDRRRHTEAIALWEQSVHLDPHFSIPWRNLGIAYFNIANNPAKSRAAYQCAMLANPSDARLLYEYDQLLKRIGAPPDERIAALENRPDLLSSRDDLTLEYCGMLNQTRRHDQALHILNARRFQPWEGGEGLALAQWEHTHLALARQAMAARQFDQAIGLMQNAFHPPQSLGEAKHLLANGAELHYWAGRAAKAAGDATAAATHWEAAAADIGDFQRMATCTYSEASFFSGLSFLALGRRVEARTLFTAMLAFALTLRDAPAKIDYFATSLPTMLLFDENLEESQRRQAGLIEALAHAGLNLESNEDAAAARPPLVRFFDIHQHYAFASDFLAALEC